MAQTLQGFSYNVCSAILRNCFAFGLSVMVFAVRPSYTNDLMLCYKHIQGSLIFGIDQSHNGINWCIMADLKI